MVTIEGEREKKELEKDAVKELWKDNRSRERLPEGLIHLCSSGRNRWDGGTKKVGHLVPRMHVSLMCYLTSGL